MATTTRDTTPYWTTSATVPQFAALDDDATADVVVVGGGITGLTAAALLSAAGRSVVVLDRGRCALVDTGHTSAHLTMVTDTRLHELASRVRRHATPRPSGTPGWPRSPRSTSMVRRHDDRRRLRVGRRLPARAAGADGRRDRRVCSTTRRWPRSWASTPSSSRRCRSSDGPGVRFDGQARVHPRKYLAGLARALAASGGRIYEHSEVDGVRDAPRSRDGQRPHGDVRRHRHRDAQPARRPVEHRRRRRCSRPSSRSTPATSSPGGCRQGRSCPTRCGGTPPIRTTTCASSRTATTTCVIFGGEDHKTGQVDDTDGVLSRGSRQRSGALFPASRSRTAGRVR